MRLPKRDIVASSAVAVAVVLYLLWLTDAAPFGMTTRVTGLVIPVLGFTASASAVVPGFVDLLHGNRASLVVTSLLGLVSLTAGFVMLWSADTAALAVLTGVLVLLWAISTSHHVLLARTETCPACGASVQETYCEVCGYDLVRKTRGDVTVEVMVGVPGREPPHDIDAVRQERAVGRALAGTDTPATCPKVPTRVA